MTSVTDRIDRLVGEARDKVQALEHEWILFVRWTDLLLASWPVAAEQVRPLVPGGLDIDTFDNTAWLSIVPFNAVDMHFRDLPPIPGQADFCELNLRTYVRMGDVRAVFFLSLDCPGKLADLIGAHLFDLPFKEARMQITPAGSGYHVDCQRLPADGVSPAFVADYAPTGSAATPAAGTLEDFLTSRFTLFVGERSGRLLRADIAHEPWMVQPATLSIEMNTFPHTAGLTLAGASPHALFAASTDTLVYPPTHVAFN
ncbi:MAG TPA: DUF2071 domain-containing protein [Vicinamibacterales bacterium]|nr:DUF2071 domain-containing protein [Vicinamibacterales bacterium]